MKNVLLLFLPVLFLASCNGKKKLEITAEEIDAYVAEINDPEQLFDVSQSLRFSKEDHTYEVTRFMQNDSVVLYIEKESLEDRQVVRKIYIKNNYPVFVEELNAINREANPFEERVVYLNGAEVIEAKSKASAFEDELQFLEYEEIDVDADDYDFDRPKQAMTQKGDFEMNFSEFIIMGPQSFLVLENDKSSYDVALFIADDQHPFIQRLFADPDKYKGKAVFVTHQFIIMSGIERMLFVDGRFADEKPKENEQETVESV